MEIKKVNEVVIVRGIAAAIQAMNAPTFQNLADLVKPWGYNLEKSSLNNKIDTQNGISNS